MGPAASEWKSLSDGLPAENTWVIVKDIDKLYHLGKYIKKCWRVAGKNGALPKSRITHWAEVYQPVKDNNASITTKQIQETSQVPLETSSSKET